MYPEKILIVDDMPEIRMLVKRTLKKAGFECVEASSGSQAIQTVKVQTDIVLVLLDIILPDIDGYKVMDTIEQIKGERDLKVCFMSGIKEKDSVVKAIKSGGADYIIKPIFPENLLSKVGILLKKPELIEGYSHLRVKIRAELLNLDICPDIEIRGIDELSVLLFSTAFIKPETQLEMQSKRLNQVLKAEGLYSLKVNKCRRDAFGKYSVRCRFIGLSETVAKEIRSMAIRGQFIGEAS
ncbi:response regulator [Pseudobacteriovorax antillogorgiicola]|uniref:DNA-binding response regulator, OmpR family, contains REC and winged-helix (WHTH) domain n=1 Tax=Pseudobacteriovorax antillogorgiicola TaxID=1513793 RepID=A0A1Y6CC33_9BACT|nr:response regulator [Pseudobacteriovorax antillogorgiicola]TCS48342.1 DNA-binding response OmpR family regulator [Pseudobacteriovorax antillogorgiicola]SMF56359.1 DNA-binding response regulator, OmpR family, contains REC and winged-helix (wHTH) domain [Pseudobacteriovorax antillogorgiicola]